MTNYTPEQMRALANEPRAGVIDLRAALRAAADRLELVPTREQIAEAIYLATPRADLNAEGQALYYPSADAVLALIQKGTDRG